MRTATISALAIAAGVICAAPALAQGPSALVRELHGTLAGVEVMDYVATGKVISLGPQDSIVLEYLKSCWRERIKGGTVTVGAEQSEVQGGEVMRHHVPCSRGNIELSREQANQSAGVHVQAAPQRQAAPAPERQETPALAQGPAALVEQVRGTLTGVAFMDYVAAGKVIRLGPQDSIVLGYLRSCWHETIKGGVVVIGAMQSEVQGGAVERTKVSCNGGAITLTGGQASQSAGTAVRMLDAKTVLTLHGVFPVVEADGGAALSVARVDRAGEHHVVTMPQRRGTRGSFFDFAKAKKPLAAGGSYRATIGARQILFRIDPDAKARGVPIISRLLRFPPAS